MESANKRTLKTIGNVILTIVSLVCDAVLAIFASVICIFTEYNDGAIFLFLGIIFLGFVVLPLLWIKNNSLKTKTIVIFISLAIFCAVGFSTNVYRVIHDNKLKINTNININTNEYLPFAQNTKIVKLENSSLKLTDNLPKIDGAAAVFPVYSAFVHAVYPENTELNIDTSEEYSFNYFNTPVGYQRLAEKETDIFFGAYPSDEQIEYAKSNGTTFKYIPIGKEAFVFFVNKNCPVNNLTTEQIKGIYAGEITNWNQVGGPNKEIIAYQRNKNSGSQTTLEKFMGDIPIMDAPEEQVQDLMGGVIDTVATYTNTQNAIGFSFRYYLDTLIANPDVKMLSIDGYYPNIENIKNGNYPITNYLYAVTYEECKNENVDKFIDWILSDQGQWIIEQTGYVGLENKGVFI